MESNEKDKKEYELGFLLKEEAGGGEIAELVSSLGGEIFTEGPVNRLALAYPIAKATEAFFGFLQFTMTPDQAKPLTEAMQFKANVLRHLLMTPPPMRGKKTREAREPKEPHETDRPQRSYSARPAEGRPAALSNEALEKKIEEILQ